MGAAKEKVVEWSGSLGIEQAESLKNELSNALAENNNVVLNLSKVEDIDTTTIQLIIAAQKEAEKRGINFKVDKNLPESTVNFLNLLSLPINETEISKMSDEV